MNRRTKQRNARSQQNEAVDSCAKATTEGVKTLISYRHHSQFTVDTVHVVIMSRTAEDGIGTIDTLTSAQTGAASILDHGVSCVVPCAESQKVTIKTSGHTHAEGAVMPTTAPSTEYGTCLVQQEPSPKTNHHPNQPASQPVLATALQHHTPS